MKTLVIPSNRPERLEKFFEAWKGRGGWDNVILVEDGPSKSEFKHDENLLHYCWEDIEGLLGEDAWIISRKDSAIRCFGFLMAATCLSDYILTLDDDCYPVPEGYAEGTVFDQHLFYMTNFHSPWMETAGMRTRGIPYMTHESPKVLVDVNVGLWEGVGDWDSIQDHPSGYFLPSPGHGLVPHGVLIPMCGMNLCFTRRVIPLMYFPLMGEGQPFSRFDDIWAGILCKRMLDSVGGLMGFGEPFVHHIRASDPEVNRIKEAPGIEANETFWQMIPDTLGSTTPLEAVEIMEELLSSSIPKDCPYAHYMMRLRFALATWAELLEELYDVA